MPSGCKIKMKGYACKTTYCYLAHAERSDYRVKPLLVLHLSKQISLCSKMG